MDVICTINNIPQSKRLFIIIIITYDHPNLHRQAVVFVIVW